MRRWTEQEISYLQRWYLRQPVQRTAEVLNRNKGSVCWKAFELGLNHYKDNLSARTIADCFCCDVRTVMRWVDKMGLPARKIYCGSQTRYVVEADQFWEWAEQHKSEINWSKYELKSILPEPEWVRSEKLNYKKKQKMYA